MAMTLTPVVRRFRFYRRTHSPVAEARPGHQVQASSDPGPHHPHAALQSLLCLLQRVRQGFRSVPTAEMLRRIEILAGMGTGIITISGGEPLLHPDLDEIIRAIRNHGAIATIITNGYLLTPERIQRLNRAGLEHLQISIDNVMPDEVSKKSLKVLDRKLEWLAQYAEFDININSVLGGGMAHPEDALTITRRAQELGFETTVGIIHDHDGQLDPLKENERAVYDQILKERSRRCLLLPTTTCSTKTWLWASPTTGNAVRAAVTCTSVSRVWCTIARSSAAIRRSRWRSTPRPTWTGNTRPRSPVRHSALFPACTG